MTNEPTPAEATSPVLPEPLRQLIVQGLRDKLASLERGRASTIQEAERRKDALDRHREKTDRAQGVVSKGSIDSARRIEADQQKALDRLQDHIRIMAIWIEEIKQQIAEIESQDN